MLQRRRRTPCPTTGCRTRTSSRLQPVLAVAYLIFNEGYAATAECRLMRLDLCAEGIRLARLLAELMPDEPEAQGLLALLLLLHARSAARVRSRPPSTLSIPLRPALTASTGTLS
jgi:predicted RNA polymerase sigma factor